MLHFSTAPISATLLKRRLQLPSPVGSTPGRETLVADNAEGEAGKDWRQGRDPRAVCHISDGRGGYTALTVKNHPPPDFTTCPIVTRANMTKTEFRRMKITQDPVGRFVRSRVNSTEGHLRWLLLARKRPQRWVVTLKSFLYTSACYNTELESPPSWSRAGPYGKCRLKKDLEEFKERFTAKAPSRGVVMLRISPVDTTK